MERLGGEEIGRRASIRQVAFASFIGTAIEWYDFFLYGTAAALVFNRLFFPELAPLTGTLASFATFGVGFFARPVGGVVFGHFGDRVGRKSMLVITLLVMGGATFLIGLLPTFETIGIWAPILLVVLRFLQGFAVGGEWGGATLMAVEHAPEESRNFYASWPQMGAPAGLVLSTAVFTVFSSLPDEQFFAWGWRVPFLLSIILIGVGLFIRLRVLESPAFSRVKELGAESRVPLLEVLRNYPVAALLAIGVVLVNIGGYYIVITFTLSYVTEQLGVARNVPLIGLLLAGLAEIAGILLFAYVADRVGRRPVALWSAAFVFLLAYPYFWLVNTGAPPLIWAAMSL
jgi:MFS transporter, MHS family, shikimate and dehydroshikimate transport protein